MERRLARSATPPPRRSVDEIKADLARLMKELAQAEARDQQERRRDAVQRKDELLPATPSPKKKRKTLDVIPGAVNPPFVMHDSTLAGPPPPIFSHADSVRAKSRIEQDSKSRFASHESALLRKPASSSLLAGLRGIATKKQENDSRRQLIENRSTSFAQPSTSKVVDDARSNQITKKDENERAAKRISSESELKENSAEIVKSAGAKIGRLAPTNTATKATNLAAEDESDDPVAAMIKRRKERELAEAGESSEDELEVVDGPPGPKIRSHDGTLIEHLKLGPKRHKRIEGDPNFNTIEPNSGIRLKSRELSHQDFTLYLNDRYILSPALIYSLARQQTGSDAYEIPVTADFILICVIAWKGETKLTNPGKNAAGETKERRNIRFSLVDLSSERASQSGTGVLSMILFESETADVAADGTKRYKGGSQGAYEKFWKESPGAVIAILNPKIMKPRFEPGQANIFTLTPNSADSILVIGRAKDLASCQARKADGNLCASWCDARVNSFCDYHVQRSVKAVGSRRPETANITSSLSSTAHFNPSKFAQSLQIGTRRGLTASTSSNPDYEKKSGLLPRNNISVQDGLATYTTNSATSFSTSHGKKRTITSHELRAAAVQSGNGSGGFIQGVRDGPSERETKKMREREKLAKRKTRQELKELTGKRAGTSLGAQYLKSATQVFKKDPEREAESDYSEEAESDDGRSLGERAEKKRVFTAAVVRSIGYDPTNHKDDDDEQTKKSRLESISLLAQNRPAPKLSAPPGPKIRSGVVAPKRQTSRAGSASDDGLPDLPELPGAQSDGEEEDLVIEGTPRSPMKRLTRPQAN